MISSHHCVDVTKQPLLGSHPQGFIVVVTRAAVPRLTLKQASEPPAHRESPRVSFQCPVSGGVITIIKPIPGAKLASRIFDDSECNIHTFRRGGAKLPHCVSSLVRRMADAYGSLVSQNDGHLTYYLQCAYYVSYSCASIIKCSMTQKTRLFNIIKHG